MISIASSIGSTAAGLSMLTSGFENMFQMFKTGEHTLSGWLGILTSLGFAIPMVAGGIKGLGAAIGFTTASTAAANAVAKINESLVERKIALNSAEAISEKATALSKIFGIGVDEAKNLLTEEGNLKTSKAILLSTSMAAASMLEAIGISATVPAKIASAAASGSAAAAELAMLWPIGLLVAALAALAVGIFAVVKIIGALTDAYNADSIAAEKAREEAKALADSYSTIKEKYEELKKSIEDYHNAKNAIAALKEGT